MRGPFPRTTNQLAATLSARSRRVEPRNTPTHIFLEVTNRCNLSCVMCGRTHDGRHKEPGFTGNISLRTVQKLERFYHSSTFVTATGLGEPFLNPDMTKILRYLKSRRACVSLTSNGTLLHEDLSAAVINTGLDRIVFLIDSPVPETFRRIRVGTTLEEVLANISTFSRLRATTGQRVPYMILEFVAMAQNFKQLPEIADLAAQLDFDEVIVQNLFKAFEPGYNAFYQKNKLADLPPDVVLKTWNEFEKRLEGHGIRLYSPFSDGGIHEYVARTDQDLPRKLPRGTPLMGFIDEPKTQEQVIAPFRVSGWLLGQTGLPTAEIALESATEVLNLPVEFGVERPDVLPHLPEGFPAESGCGFSVSVNRLDLEPGVYTLSLFAREGATAQRLTIARHQIVVGETPEQQMYCTQPWTTFFVAWDGTVRTCCFNEYALGNVNFASAEEVWRGAEYREFREKVVSGKVVPGTDAVGARDFGSAGCGVEIFDSTNSQVGGAENEGNLISGNDLGGFCLNRSEGTLIQGNMIDTTPDGEEAFVTSLPSSADGVSAVASSGNTIGGTFPKAGNIIAVGGVGVRILPLGANRSDENKIFGNRISVDSTGTKALGEGKVGVSVDGSNNQVGSGLENGVNTVAFQTGDGIRVTRGTNEILYNSTFSNGGLGIELGGGNGVNENDDLDAADGPNGLQNFPVLEGAGDSTIGGFLDSKPNTDYLLEFYRSDECDPSGHGEGKTYLGTLDGVRTDALGRAEFDTAFGADSGFVTATATEASDEGLFGTSEFSACLEFSPPLTFVVNSSGDAAEPVEKRGDGECWTGGMIEREEKEKTKKECTLRAAITEANLVKGANRIHFDIPGDQVHTLQPVVGVQAGLPAITGKVWIDGNTQPGAARATEDRPAMLKIEIDGSRAGPDAIGLSLASGSEESRISGLVINRFLSTGVLLQAAGSTVDGNHIGSDATGTTEVVPLQPFGVAVENSAGNSIGGPGAGLGNIIFGRVDVRGAGSRFNQILGNFIAAGDDAGIAIFQGGSNTVGTEAHSNTIVGAFAAINIHLSEDNEIVGNHVGCDCPEGGIRTNQRGVVILNSPRTVIRENTIQGTQSLVLAGGIFVSGKMSTQTMVLGNFVHANRGDGITVLSDAAQTTIRGNAILENEGHGIAVRARASETMIWNNFIEGNKAHGVLVDENASDTLIGDLDPAKRNIILNNGGFKDEINAEVRISRSRRNKILSNQIGAPGIVLRNRGDTKERELDAEDRDRGPNDLINHPVIQSVSSQPGSSSVVVVLSNPPSQNIVQLFDNAACVEGRGGGESLIEMKLDIETFEYFGATVTFNPGPLTEGHFLTATVTDAEGNTSEFSDCFQVLPDSDVDGVADETEDQLTPTGDGNSDGTADSQQPLVLTRADRQGRPFTMEGTAGVERLEMGSSLPSLFPPDDGAAAESVWLTEPSEVRAEMNQGTVPLGQPGEVTLTVFFPPDLVPETYVNFGPTPEDPVEHAYEFLFDGTTGAEILADQIVLHFIDGERGDHDLSVNGEILIRGAPAAAARRFYFPQIGDGLVANIQLQSSSILGNTGVFSPVQLELFDSLGGFFEVDFGELGKSSIFQIALEEGESISAQSAGTEAIQAGYAEVIARPPVGGTAVFSRRDATTDTLLYEAGVPASDPLTDFTVYVDTVGIRETGLAIACPSSGSSTSPAGAADANLILRLYDAGFNLLETANLSLAPGTHQAKFIPQFFEGNPQATEMEGTVTVESDAPVAAVTLRQNDDPAVSFPQEVPTLATFPVVPGRADDPASSAQGGMHSTFFFPQVGDGTVASIRLQTSLIFVNAGAGTDLLLEFFDSLGDPLPLDLGDLGTESSFDLNLGSGEALSVLTAGTGSLQVGYARVTTSPAVGGTAVFTRADVPSGSLLYEAGVPASTPLSDLSMVVDTSGDRSTGLALVVPPDAAPSGDVSVILRLFDQAFSLLSEVTLQLAPGEHLPRFVDQLFPDVEGIDEMEGSLTIESSVPLAAVTIRQNDQPGVEFPNEVPTLTTFPVIQGRAAR